MNIWRLINTTDEKLTQLNKIGYMCAIECGLENTYMFCFNDMCYIIESNLFERGYKKVEFYAHEKIYRFEFVYTEENIDNINLFEIHGNEDIREWL